MENTTILLISSVSFILILSAITKILGQYIKIPFTIFLVITGFIAAHIARLGPDYLAQLTDFKINPYIVLYVCLPTLVFESAFALDVRLFRRNLLPAITLAMPGLFISTAIIAGITYYLTSLDIFTALLVGAILSGTDPVAVIALFKQLGVPKRLSVLVEGESLLNNSTAIVTTKTILAVMLSGYAGTSTILHAGSYFMFEFFGGIVVGAIMAYLFGYLIKWLKEEPIAQLSLVVILAYLSYIIADRFLHMSGIMATIMSGIMMAGWGKTRLSVEANNYLHQLLKLLAYIANALIFLLVGFTVKPGLFQTGFQTILVVILAMVSARAMVIYTLIPVINKFANIGKIDFRFQTIIWWGGLKGSIALALVLSLTILPNQDVLISIVFSAVLFTILVQGLSINKLIGIFKLDKPDLSDTVSRLEAEIAAERKTLERVPGLQAGGLFSNKVIEAVQLKCKKMIQAKRQILSKLRESKLNESEEKRLLFINCYALEKNLFDTMYANGYLTGDTFHKLNYNVDVELDMMRYHSRVSQKVPLGIIQVLKEKILYMLPNLNWLNHYINRIKTRDTIDFYEEQWGLHQGCIEVLDYLDKIEENVAFKKNVINEVRTQFKDWREVTKQYLDKMALEFPEFVTDMQRRLVERILFHAKNEVIHEKFHQGLLPEGAAETLVHQYEMEIRELKKAQLEKFELSAYELLIRVPFLTSIPANKASQVIEMFDEMHITQNEYVFHEGDAGKEMYLIMRGLIRVTKKIGGKEREIATLKPGEFFGEIALINDVARTASCKAVTPCIIYSLNRQQFDELTQEYPEIKAELERTAKERD